MPLTVIGAVVAGLIGPEPPSDGPLPGTSAVADSYDGFDTDAAEQLRQDQCLMAGALRLGGPEMGGIAQTALNQTPEQLHVAADQEYWNDTPLALAYVKDRELIDQESATLDPRVQAWQDTLSGLSTPGGFKSVTDFSWPPGSGGGADFFDQVGYSTWLGEQWWKEEARFYEDPSAKADEATVKAVTDLGTPLYGDAVYDPSMSQEEWALAVEQEHAFDELLTGDLFSGMREDDARMFLSVGGFPSSAPEPGSLAFRLAVEDLKTRFAACTWTNPVDPGKVLGQEVATASVEWQREVAEQAIPRNQFIDANRDATKALATGAKALGEMLGQSWTADHLARWQDYWSPGGAGWIGDSPMIVHIHAASDKCLEVAGNSKADGAVVQMCTCNGGANQKWRVDGDSLVNVNSGKCLDVNRDGTADGTRIQQWTCKQNGAQG